jgi:hypothetical protein
VKRPAGTKADALGMFNKGVKGENMTEIFGKKGFPVGKEIMQNAADGQIKEVTYWWPRPGSETPRGKTTFYTKVADQNCGVGFCRQ